MSAPSMTLFQHPASPFVRKVLVLLHETGQQDRVALETVLVTPVNPIRPCAWPMAMCCTTAG